MRGDLHVHTTASDGRLSPAEVVRRAVATGLEAIAITDHDTVDGVGPALEEARKFPGLLVIPGVELSTDVTGGEVHVLGYFVDHQQVEFGLRLQKLRDTRITRGRRMVERLADLGIKLDWDRVLGLADGASIGRPHLAQAMLEGGYVSSLHQAFDDYIGRHGPAYVNREKLTSVQAVRLIAKAEGLAVLAHPEGIEGLDVLVPQLRQAGLVGLEAYYRGYAAATTDWLCRLAQEWDLIPCGGSDYHGFEGDREEDLGQFSIPAESIARLIALANRPSA